jgi:hypothetical protein
MGFCYGSESLGQLIASTSQSGVWKKKAGRCHMEKLNVPGKGKCAWVADSCRHKTVLEFQLYFLQIS